MLSPVSAKKNLEPINQFVDPRRDGGNIVMKDKIYDNVD
jgi:hypothetical protein